MDEASVRRIYRQFLAVLPKPEAAFALMPRAQRDICAHVIKAQTNAFLHTTHLPTLPTEYLEQDAIKLPGWQEEVFICGLSGAMHGYFATAYLLAGTLTQEPVDLEQL